MWEETRIVIVDSDERRRQDLQLVFDFIGEPARALSYQNYDYKLVFGEGEHNGKHAGTIFPESLQWLWRGWEEASP